MICEPFLRTSAGGFFSVDFFPLILADEIPQIFTELIIILHRSADFLRTSGGGYFSTDYFPLILAEVKRRFPLIKFCFCANLRTFSADICGISIEEISPFGRNDTTKFRFRILIFYVLELKN